MFESQSIRKRKRSVSTVSVESEDDDHAERSEPDDKVQKKVQGKGIKAEKQPEMKKVSAKPTRYSRSYPRAIDGPRTPTPPPEHTRETWGAGFRFSQAENDFALHYAKILIDRDHEVSQSVVTAAIHKKVNPVLLIPQIFIHFCFCLTASSSSVGIMANAFHKHCFRVGDMAQACRHRISKSSKSERSGSCCKCGFGLVGSTKGNACRRFTFVGRPSQRKPLYPGRPRKRH